MDSRYLITPSVTYLLLKKINITSSTNFAVKRSSICLTMKYWVMCGRGSMRLGREQHKAMVQLKREWNQPDAAGDNKLNVEKEQNSREKKSKSWGIRGSNLAGNRKAGSSKEQTD